MTLATKKIWPFLLVVFLITQKEIISVEINTIILLIFTGFFLVINQGRIIKRDFEILSILVLIIGIGVLSAIFNNPSAFNFIRDLLYFTKPVILILLGYFIARKINNGKIVFKVLIYLGVGYAVYHILHTFIFTDFKNATVSTIRGINGLGNSIEMYSIALIILGNKYPEFNVISNKKTKHLFLLFLTMSFIFYFSRTMFVGLIFLILGVLNYLKLNKKGLKYLLLLLTMFIGLYAYLYSTEINRQGGALESFLYKLKMAPGEIFTPKLDLDNKAALWDHWRAYEAYCAFESLNESPVNYINGKGFGALVDLKFPAPLSDEGNLRYIPILHNGYVFVLYKTGIMGLLLYLVFLFYLYYQAYQKTENIEIKIFGNLLSATSAYIIFSSLIITGLYNKEEEIALLLGVFLFLKSNANLKEKRKL